MARHTYKLTDETRRVLTDRASQIADAMDVDPSYIYAFLSGAESDVYAKFRRLFRAAANADAPAEIWLHELTAIYAGAKGRFVTGDAGDALLEKIRTDAQTTETLVAALGDGKIDKREAYELLAAVNKMRAVAETLDSILHARLGELCEAETAPKLRQVK